MRLGRYDWAVYSAFICYAVSSLALPLAIVDMADDLNFRLDAGGMTAGGGLHLLRSAAVVVMLLGCGALAGKIGKRRSMGLSMFLTGAGICACSLSTRYWMLLPFLFAAGLGEGLCEGIATPFVEGLHREETERYVNIAHGFWSVGIAAAVLLAGGILSFGVSWQAVLALSGLAALGTCLLLFWRENPDKRYT